MEEEGQEKCWSDLEVGLSRGPVPLPWPRLRSVLTWRGLCVSFQVLAAGLGHAGPLCPARRLSVLLLLPRQAGAQTVRPPAPRLLCAQGHVAQLGQGAAGERVSTWLRCGWETGFHADMLSPAMGGSEGNPEPWLRDLKTSVIYDSHPFIRQDALS